MNERYKCIISATSVRNEKSRCQTINERTTLGPMAYYKWRAERSERTKKLTCVCALCVSYDGMIEEQASLHAEMDVHTNTRVRNQCASSLSAIVASIISFAHCCSSYFMRAVSRKMESFKNKKSKTYAFLSSSSAASPSLMSHETAVNYIVDVCVCVLAKLFYLISCAASNHFHNAWMPLEVPTWNHRCRLIFVRQRQEQPSLDA